MPGFLDRTKISRVGANTMRSVILTFLAIALLVTALPFVAFGGEGGDDDSARPVLSSELPPAE